MNSILKRERELFQESWNLRNATFELSKNEYDKQKKYKHTKELQERQKEIYKKQQFFKKYLEEMEKIGK